uniref:PSI-G n=1 Tax=Mesostigma viride TaxID=41882 RepID=A0A7S4X3M1_MESVI|eukprot:jgi/Mesvir1/8644/Mv02589-RA.1
MAATLSFAGLRKVNAVDNLNVRAEAKVSRPSGKVSSGVNHRKETVCFAPNVTICVCNALMLSLGRFAFLPWQRYTNSKAGQPKQNGVTHFDSGDNYAAEMTTMLKSNDPAGFNVIDVLAWGSLGHALGYAALAIESNGYNFPL